MSAIDKVVCADRGLLQKHIHVDDMQRSLENAAGFPKMLRIGQLHRAWLNAREQCAGPDVIACLARLYDARIEELADAIVTEEQSKQ